VSLQPIALEQDSIALCRRFWFTWTTEKYI